MIWNFKVVSVAEIAFRTLSAGEVRAGGRC